MNFLQVARRVKQLVKDEVQVHLVTSSEMAREWEGSLLYDADSSVHAHYGIRVPSMAFIRPDGYLGLLCQSTQEQELVDYLERIYLLPHQSGTVARISPSKVKKSGQQKNSSVV